MDEYAASIGVEDPESYENKESLYRAVRAKEAEGENVADEQQKAPEQKASTRSSGADDGGASQVQEMFDKEHEQGYVGRKTDPTPNENYSMEGGAPEPGDNPTTPSEEDVKADPTLGDQYEGQKTYTEPE